jgi:hypothetical protein
MVGINVTRSIRNLLQFGVLACAIVIVATFDRNCVIAQNSAPVLQNVHTVSGIVRMQGNGEAIAGARGRVVKKEDTYVVLGSNQATRTAPKREYSFTTDKSGRWSVNNLPDGSYVIQITPGLTDSDRNSGQWFATKKQMITVAGTDLEGVLIEVSKGAKISGTLIVEGDEPLSSLTLDASKVDAPFELHQAVSKSLTPTGRITTFTLTDVPEGVIELNAFLQTDSHYIKSISANGIDLLQEKLKLTSGMEVTNLEVVVSSDLAEFTGRIISESGKTPLPRMKIFLNWTGKRRVLGGRLTRWIDEQGTFLLRPPPGEYQIYVYGDRVEGATLPLVKSLPPMTFRPREQQNIEIRVP